MKKKFEDLEKRIQKLITSHQELKSENSVLKGEKAELDKMLAEEKERSKRTEQGYRQLREREQTVTAKNIDGIKIKISHLVGEIDKNIALIDEKK